MQRIVKIALASIALYSVCITEARAQVVDEPHPTPGSWSAAVEPFRIAGNLYYVGSEDLSSYLVTTSQGHILINTGIASSADMIQKNVEALGFRFADIKILLASHVHFDHVGALAEIKRRTGAKVYINRNDAGVLADGGKSDYVFGGDTSSFQPVTADVLLEDQSVIKLGNMEITALHHPGHTRGANSFVLNVKDAGRSYRVLIANMPSIVFEERFADMKAYPGVAADYDHTFRELKKQQFDIWLAAHGSQFNLPEKRKKGDRYNPGVFGDKGNYHAAIDKLYERYLEKLKKG